MSIPSPLSFPRKRESKGALKSFKKQNMEKIVDSLKIWLRLPVRFRPRKKIEIESINDVDQEETLDFDLLQLEKALLTVLH